jgi:hypothetical protein
LGGPLASLTLGALLMLLFIASPGSAWAGVGELAGLGATCSLALFLVSIWPWHAGGYRSDGAQLLTILRHGPEYHRDRALALIAGDWLKGIAPRNWNPEHLRIAASRADVSRQHATACALNYLYCVDNDFGSRPAIGLEDWRPNLPKTAARCPCGGGSKSFTTWPPTMRRAASVMHRHGVDRRATDKVRRTRCG